MHMTATGTGTALRTAALLVTAVVELVAGVNFVCGMPQASGMCVAIYLSLLVAFVDRCMSACVVYVNIYMYAWV